MGKAAAGNLRSERWWHFSEQVGNKNQADCQLPSLPSHQILGALGSGGGAVST